MSWEQWLKLWPQVTLNNLPGFPYWERQVFRALSENLGVLLRVFGHYAKMTLLRTLTSSPDGKSASGGAANALVIGRLEWLTFVKECKLFSKKLGNDRTQRQLTISQAQAATATFPEFLAAIVKLSFWRANPALEEGNTEMIDAARREFRVRALPDCFVAVLHNHILPMAQRDSSQRFRARLAQDEGVQSLMRDYKDQIQETFMQLVASESAESAGVLECPTALAWLEQCGVLGHAAVKAPPILGPDGNPMSTAPSRTVTSVLTVEDAAEAFVEALPAVACLGPSVLGSEGDAAPQLTSLRHFQEWIARCGELKYSQLAHLQVAERTGGFLSNCFERKTTEAFVLSAMLPPSADKFDAPNWVPPPEMNPSELSLLLSAWERIDLSMLPGYPIFEQSVFELLAQCMGPLAGIFGYYCRSSLHHADPALMGYVELQGWNDFIADCNGITKSFSAQRAAELYMDAPKQRDGGLTFAEFIQTVVLCAFQRANAELLDLHKKTAPRLVPVEQSLHTLLNGNMLPLAKSRNLVDAHRTFQEDEELLRTLGEREAVLIGLFLAAKPYSSIQKENGELDGGFGEMSSVSAFGSSLGAGPDEGDSVDVDQFVGGLARLFTHVELYLSVWVSSITPVQPSEVGNMQTKPFRSKFSAIDAKQAFLDTLLAESLVVSSTLPHESGACTGRLQTSGLLEACVRCALAKYNAVNVLTTAGKTAALLDGLMLALDEQSAVSKYVEDMAPERFDLSEAQRPRSEDNPHKTSEHAAWLALWKLLDLQDLPGFPEWDRAAFEQMQAYWPTLLSIFVFYSRGYGGNAAAHGNITPWGFLQWADDSKVITKIFTDARVQDIYDYDVHAQFGGLAGDALLVLLGGRRAMRDGARQPEMAARRERSADDRLNRGLSHPRARLPRPLPPQLRPALLPARPRPRLLVAILARQCRKAGRRGERGGADAGPRASEQCRRAARRS